MDWLKPSLTVLIWLIVPPALAGSGPVGYWSFNEPPGSIRLHDAIGGGDGLYQHHGALASLAEAPADGPASEPSQASGGVGALGRAVRFGPDDSVFLGRPAVLERGRESFTLTGWFAADPVERDEHRMLVDFARHNQGGYAVFITRAGNREKGRLAFDVKGREGGNVTVTSDARVDDGRWHAFAAVVADGHLTLYLDGRRQRSTAELAAGSSATPPAATQAYLATRYEGRLDDLALFDRPLREDEVRTIHTRGLAAYGLPGDGVVEEDVSPSIRVTERIVFDGHAGWEHQGLTYRLAVGVILAQAPNGDLLLAWTTGGDNEPADDNCGVLARSSDGGTTWSTPQILVPVRDGMQGVITNLYRTRDGKVVLYGAHLPPEDRYTTWHYFRMISEDNGKTWSEPTPFNLRDAHGSLGQGEIPIALDEGGYLYVGHWYRRHEAPLVAPVTALSRAETMAEAQAMPAGEGRTGGVFAEFWQGLQAYVAPDDYGTTFEPRGFVFDRPLGLIEPTTIQLKDGTVAVLARADWGGFLWRTDSTDGGRTWSKARPTDIPNPSSMTDLVRLSDGRIALIHNPVGGVVGERAKRDPLAIWISDDEMETWSVRATVATGGQLAYPDSIVLDDGRLVFAYDRDRRQVRFVEVHLPPRED